MSLVSNQTFTRMSGAGNTFVFIEQISKKNQFLQKEKRPALAKKICNDIGIKTDGFVIIEEHKDFDFIWDFYNADGSKAEMCGNAARCAALFFKKKIKDKAHIDFLTLAGPISADVDVQQKIVSVVLTETSPGKRIKIPLKNKNYEGFYINTGVPHFVIEANPDEQLAQEIRWHKSFYSQGTNVTFVENLGQGLIQAISFERGVEGFTEACGTGAVAAGEYFKNKEESEVFVSMPGGILSIQWNKNRPILSGTAELEFEFSIYEEEL